GFSQFRQDLTVVIFTDKLQVLPGHFAVGGWRSLHQSQKFWMLPTRWRSSALKRFTPNIETCFCHLSRRPKQTGNVCSCVMALRLSWPILFSTDRSWKDKLCQLHESGDAKMRQIFCVMLIAIVSGTLAAQTQTKNTGNRSASRIVVEGQPASIRLGLRVTTTIRLPEPVNSVVLGDSNLFQAEYSPS